MNLKMIKEKRKKKKKTENSSKSTCLPLFCVFICKLNVSSHNLPSIVSHHHCCFRHFLPLVSPIHPVHPYWDPTLLLVFLLGSGPFQSVHLRHGSSEGRIHSVGLLIWFTWVLGRWVGRRYPPWLHMHPDRDQHFGFELDVVSNLLRWSCTFLQ